MFHRPGGLTSALHEESGGPPDTSPHPRRKYQCGIKDKRKQEPEFGGPGHRVLMLLSIEQPAVLPCQCGGPSIYEAACCSLHQADATALASRLGICRVTVDEPGRMPFRVFLTR